MRQRIVDLAVVLSAQDDLLARAGAAIMAHEPLPHAALRLMEKFYPEETAKARFWALWSARESNAPDPEAIGREFKMQLTDTFKRLGRLVEHSTVVIGTEPKRRESD